MPPTVDYYFVPASPFTYFGHQAFGRLARRRGLTVRVRPVDARIVFAPNGFVPLPQRSAARKAYRMMELRRIRAERALPANLEPKHFPVDDTMARGAIIAVDRAGGDALEFAFRIMRAVWVEERDIADRTTLGQIATGLGYDAEAILTAIDGEAVAAQQDAHNRVGLAAGVFGAPTWALETGELFWGQDRLGALERVLETLDRS